MTVERYKIKVAVYLLLIKDDKVLLGRRFNTGWQDGNYGVPAGHLESNETLVQGSIREAEEETGVKVKEENVKHIHTMHRMNRYLDIFFMTNVWEGDPSITEPDKCDDIKWFPLDNLPENMIPSIKHTIEQYKKNNFFSEFNSPEN